jgi:hypothetical protein
MADLHGALAANHKAVATAVNAKRSGNEAAAAASTVRAAEARERMAKIEAGEEVAGGLGQPLSNAAMIAILKAAGLTNAEIRHMRLQYDLIEVIGTRLGEPGVEKVLDALTEIAVKVAIEAPDRAVRQFTRKLARLMFADEGHDAGGADEPQSARDGRSPGEAMTLGNMRDYVRIRRKRTSRL